MSERKPIMMLRRRDALMTTLFGAGHIGLRALATGPARVVPDEPAAARTAQSLQCANRCARQLAVTLI